MALPLRSFSDTDAFIGELREDATRRERFPVRIILVEGLNRWRELVERLRLEVDAVLCLSSFCAGKDIYPCPISVKGRIEQWLKEHTPGTILILPWAEWLRLEEGQEEQGALELLVNLVQKEKVGKKRVYIPLLGTAEVVNRLEERLTRYHVQGGLPPVWKLSGKGSVTVKVVPFVLKHSSCRVVQGIKAYLECWETGGAEELILVTEWALWLKGSKASFTIQICKNAYQVLAYRVASWPTELREEWGSEEDWRWLAQEGQESESFFQLAARLLNIKEYESSHLMQRWKDLGSRQRWLAWLWSKLEQAQTGYLGKVLAASTGVKEFEKGLIMSVLETQLTPAEARERKALLETMGATELPKAFLDAVAELPDPLQRLACLTGFSEEEKELAVLAVKQLLERNVPEGKWWAYLEVAYPELSWYLTIPPIKEVPEAQLQEYFQLYTRSRVCDGPYGQLLELARRVAADQTLWKCRPRDQALEELKHQGVVKILWVDGLGVEWLGVLLKALHSHGDVTATFEVVRANLPTITEANKGWHTEDGVERAVDQEGHRIPYLHARTLVRQLDAVCKVAYRAVHLLDTTGEVIITSDHGLTRFAKTSGGIRLPGDVQVHKWGRCATVPPGFSLATLSQPECLLYGRTLVLLTHEKLYGQTGVSYQVHGGATPEEWLVPVVRVRKASRKYRAEMVRVRVLTPKVALNIRGEGELQVELTGYEGKAVELHIMQHIFAGRQRAGGVWVFGLRGLEGGRYQGFLQGDTGKLVEIEFDAVKGLAEEDLGL